MIGSWNGHNRPTVQRTTCKVQESCLGTVPLTDFEIISGESQMNGELSLHNQDLNWRELHMKYQLSHMAARPLESVLGAKIDEFSTAIRDGLFSDLLQVP